MSVSVCGGVRGEGSTSSQSRRDVISRPAKERQKKDVRTFPRARRAPSKKSMTPSIMKNTPNEVSPTPISVRVPIWTMSVFVFR